MPFAIDEKAARKQMNWNVSRPQEVAPNPLPEGWIGTVSGGLPVKQIPHLEFPKVVYLHPNSPTRKIVHRNQAREIVDVEELQTEHLTKVVNDEAELQAALDEGWQTKPYIAPPLPREDEGLYGPRKTTKGEQE